MADKVLLVKFGEIAMRGDNQYIFINRLILAIRRNLDPVGNYYVVREPGRLIVEDRGGEMDYDLVIPRVEPIFGLVALCPGIRLQEMSMDAIKEEALRHMQELYGDKPMTFKVNARRSNKGFGVASMQIAADVGEYILDHMPNMTVNVKTPDVVLNIEVRNRIYMYSKIIKTYGGLPYGSSGKGVSLLSGGIDSPVATWMMAKRGVEVEGVYFHSPPYTSEWAKQKVIDLAKRIADFTGEFKLYLLENVPHDKLTIHLKRAMMRAAEKIAEKDGAWSLITGESVGQVASQTMYALACTDCAADMPVFRPCIGMDKDEIIAISRKIDTFETSIEPYEDCCTVFTPKHPKTKPRLDDVLKAEANMENLDEMMDRAVAGVKKVVIK